MGTVGFSTTRTAVDTIRYPKEKFLRTRPETMRECGGPSITGNSLSCKIISFDTTRSWRLCQTKARTVKDGHGLLAV
jgi:hypothetical protein